MSPSFRRTRRGRRTTTARVSRESASGIRWLCISLALNIAEAKVVPASLYGPLPPTNSMSFSLFCSSSLSSHRTYLYHFTIFFSLSSSLSLFLFFNFSSLMILSFSSVKLYMNCLDIWHDTHKLPEKSMEFVEIKMFFIYSTYCFISIVKKKTKVCIII